MEKSNAVLALRLKECREKQGLSQKGLADATQGAVTQAQVSKIEKGDSDTTTFVLRKLSQVLKVSAAYLMGETDDPNAPVSESEYGEIGELNATVGGKVDKGMSFKNIIPPRNMMMIPVISSEIKPSAGYGNDYGYSDLEWTVIDTIPLADGEIAALYSADNLLSMYVEGDSMEPQIHDGDLVVFNLTQDWVSGNIMVVCLDGRLLVKGVVYDGEGKPPILRSTNKEYPDIHINENSFFVVYGRVLRIVRMSKPKPVL